MDFTKVGNKLKMVMISTSTKESLGFYKVYPAFRNRMIQIDSKRFRPFNENQKMAFAKCVYDYGRSYGLVNLEDLEFIAMTMALLGCSFYKDPRFVEIHTILSDPNGTMRVKQAIPLTNSIVGRFWGRNLTELTDRLKTILFDLDNLAKSPDSASVLKAFDRPIPLIESWFHDGNQSQQVYVEFAYKTAKALGFRGREGVNCCFWANWWFGVECEKSPLYPWMSGVLQKHLVDEQARLEVLVLFVKRRLSKT